MKALRVVFFGESRFHRASIPSILADFKNMPKADPSALDDEAQAEFACNVEAVRLFVEEPGVTLAAIQRATGVRPNQLYRLLARIVSKADDGRIEGFRGCIPHRHLKAYTRNAAVDATSASNRAGAAGAMGQLLRKHAAVERWLRKAVRHRCSKLKARELRAVRRPIRQLHRDWLAQCKKDGVTQAEWPFNSEGMGLRSFQSKVHQLELELRDENESRETEGEGEAFGTTAKPDFWPIALRPFMLLQFDGHKIDVRLTLVIPDPFGFETVVELHRVWILVVTELKTRCILGYVLALGPEYNKDDFAEALQAAIVPHRPIELTIPNLRVREGGGFPSQLQPELAYHCWDFLQYDEAKSHLSQASMDRMTRTLGTIGCGGRLGKPNDRAYEERLFGLLEEFGFHQIPGTLGSGPDDPVRELGDVGKDLTRLITLDELQQLAYVLVANLNGDPQEGVGGRTPLEAMRYFTTREDFLPRLLPTTGRHQLFLLKEAVIKTIRGNRKVIPHINFEHVRYTCDVLARHPELVGKKLRIYFMARDLRTVHAFFEDGTELGILQASKQWRTTPHSLRLRQEIFRLLNQGKLRIGHDDDPIEVYLKHKARQAKRSKDAATSLAKGQANIRAAAQDEQHGDSPFAPRSQRWPFPPAPDVVVPPPASKRHGATPVEPEPMTLTRGIVF